MHSAKALVAFQQKHQQQQQRRQKKLRQRSLSVSLIQRNAKQQRAPHA